MSPPIQHPEINNQLFVHSVLFTYIFRTRGKVVVGTRVDLRFDVDVFPPLQHLATIQRARF